MDRVVFVGKRVRQRGMMKMMMMMRAARLDEILPNTQSHSSIHKYPRFVTLTKYMQ